MKRTLLVMGLVFSSAAAAQHSHGGMQTPARASSSNMERRALPPEQPLFFDGEIDGVHKDSATVTLKHSGISVLDVPATTAAYAVKDASMLDRITPGDKVRFTAVLQGRLLVITRIVPAP